MLALEVGDGIFHLGGVDGGREALYILLQCLVVEFVVLPCYAVEQQRAMLIVLILPVGLNRDNATELICRIDVCRHVAFSGLEPAVHDAAQ